MKRAILLGAIIAVLFVLPPGTTSLVAAPSCDAGGQTTLTIKGMTCGGCVATVKLKPKKTAGVTAYEVSLERAEADASYEPALTHTKKIADSVSEQAYQPC